MLRLENWIIMDNTDLYGNAYQRLIGDVSGHLSDDSSDRLRDSHSVMTDKLTRFDPKEGFAVARDGTVYELGNQSDVKRL